MEIWKPIEGFDNYMVSNCGNVLNTRKNTFLTPYKEKNGYLRVNLSKNGKCKKFLVHRLVAEAFIPNTDNKPFIDHINTDRTDNRVNNLRWVTQKENQNNNLTKEKLSTATKNERNPSAKSVLQFSLDGKFINKYDFIKQSGIYKPTHISSCCRGKRKTAYGYIWKYYDLELYLESKLFKVFGIKNKMVA